MTDPIKTPNSDPLAVVSTLPVLSENDMASLHDMGEGVVCFRAHTKMNTFDPGVFDLLEETLDAAGRDVRAIVLANDDPRAFSAGADLSFFTRMLDGPDGPAKIGTYGKRGQGLFVRMMRSPVPVVAAVHGFALGGGCEFQLHADATVVHAGAMIGLPEAGIGLVPGWGGCTRVYARVMAANPVAAPLDLALKTFAPLFAGAIATTPQDARAAWLLRDSDLVSEDRAALPSLAKAKALELIEGYTPPAPISLPVAGPEGVDAILDKLRADQSLTDTDMTIARKLANIITGGPDAEGSVSEAQMMALEVQTLAELVAWPPVRTRVDHMLATGKRLRN